MKQLLALLLGLFVDDIGLAAGVLLWVALGAVLAQSVVDLPKAASVLWAAGLAVLLLITIYRSARRAIIEARQETRDKASSPSGLFATLGSQEGHRDMTEWTDASLLLVAHGSTSYPAAAGDLHRLADMIRGRGLFGRVDVAFWRQEPLLSADHLQGQRIYVLPFFAGLGKHTEQLIPDRLRLEGKLTRRADQVIHYCQPLGCHAGLPELIRQKALALCRKNGLDSNETALLLLGHGAREGSASRTPEAIAHALRDAGGLAEIITAYLEQTPFAADWPSLVSAKNVIAQPLLLSAGSHASSDLPPLFGMERAADSPRSVHGHRVWLQDGIGSDAELLAMMLDQVRAVGDSA